MLVAWDVNVCFVQLKWLSHLNANNEAAQKHTSHTLRAVPSENRRTAWLWVMGAPSLSISQSMAPPTSVLPRSHPSTLPPYPLSVWHHRHICRPNTALRTQTSNKISRAPSLWLCHSRFNFLPAPFQKCSVPHSSLATSCSCLGKSQHSHNTTADSNRQETAV